MLPLAKQAANIVRGKELRERSNSKRVLTSSVPRRECGDGSRRETWTSPIRPLSFLTFCLDGPLGGKKSCHQGCVFFVFLPCASGRRREAAPTLREQGSIDLATP